MVHREPSFFCFISLVFSKSVLGLYEHASFYAPFGAFFVFEGEFCKQTVNHFLKQGDESSFFCI